MIVLGFLVLITVVIVAFLTSVSTEHSTASSAAAGATGKELADASVQLVMGQIRQATSLGPNVAWASQPGMIRTYGSGGTGSYTASSSPLAYYKLYSSDNMVVDSASVSSFVPRDDVPDTWNSRPAVFTDLNAPVTSSTGTLNYPIMDPRAAEIPSGKSDPMVEGFSITSAPTAAVSATNPTPNPAPMPTKWIYVLRDGTLTAPIDADSTATAAEFKNAAAGKIPTADNPIVGRVAFWTDDETCKLNLNTACGGTYWEQPMFASDIDLAFSRYKPVAKEYNRYPGHPATTSLAPVFWSLGGLPDPYQNLFPSLMNSTHSMGADIQPSLSATGKAAFQNLLQLSPRNAWGGSAMSTIATAGYGAIATNIIPDADRLYATVDEAIFGYAARDSQSGNKNALSMTHDDLKKLRFFLTTTSRSPETNPFNQPKVGIWPLPEVNDGARPPASFRSAADNLIAFCSTLKPDPSTTATTTTSNFTYFFTRNNAQSATADWTTRNNQVFDYLDTDFQKPVPGFGASIDSRYTVPGGRRILTLIYDYIRSTFNLLDTSFGSTGSAPYLFFNNTFMGAANNPQGYGFGQVVPIQVTKDGTTLKGVGRFPLIKQVAVMFMVRASNQPPLACTPNGRPVVYDASHNVISDASGNILPASYPIVFGGNAYAKLNPQHPWVAGSVIDVNLGTTYVPQFKSGGNTVMAIDSALFAANPNDPAAFLPVFGVGVTDRISGSSVASITDNSVPASSGYTQYPTIYGTATANGYWGITAGTTGNITVSGTPYAYAKAAFPPTPGSQLNPPQTHAGMPYLTVQSADSTTGLAGAFAVPNPRYQGKNINSSYELPDPVNLPPGSTQMQAAFLVDPVNVAPGNTPLIPKYQVTATGLDAFRADGASLGFGSPITQANQLMTFNSGTIYHNLGMQSISIGPGVYLPTRTSAGTNQYKLNWIGAPVIVSGTSFAFTGGTIQVDMYAAPIAGGNPVPVVTSGANASTLVQTYNIQFPNDTFPTPLLPQMPSDKAGAQFANELISVSGSPNFLYNANNDPGPYGNSGSIATDPLNVPSRIADLVPSCLLTSDAATSLSKNPNFGVGASFILPATRTSWAPIVTTACYSSAASPSSNDPSSPSVHSRFCYGAGNDTGMLAYFLPQRNGYPGADVRVKLSCDTIRSVECLYGDPRVFASLPVVGTQFFRPHRFYSDLDMRAAHTFRGAISGGYPDSSRNSSSNWRGATDHNLSDAYVSDASWNYNPWANGTPTANYANANLLARAQGDKFAQLAGYAAGGVQNGMLRSQAPYTTSSSEFLDSLYTATPVWNGTTKFSDVWKTGGDFSNGVGSEPDGPYINKPNEAGGLVSAGTSAFSYYPEWWNYNGTDVFTLSSQFTPNRLICSPVAFGSLPAGNTPTDAWRTLLFCANPNASTPSAYATRMAGTDVTLANQVPTGAKCPDHLLLDFFAMPVVEPYAISEPFSTAGKVNMNYQIAPFTYIKRDTALRGVFRGTMLTAVNDQYVPSKTGNEESFYKSNIMNTSLSAITFATATDKYGQFLTASGNWGFRYPIHAAETLKQFQARFDGGDLFRSPSEICSLFLYPGTQPTPANPSAPGTPLVLWDANNANILNWWYANPGTTRKSLTGDNMRERPYDTLYPRLTTKSNSYTVHFRVQVLKKVPGTSVTQWVDGKDVVASEYRGSSLIERYIDPSDPNLPDFAVNPTATLDNYYKFRVVSTKKFTAE